MFIHRPFRYGDPELSCREPACRKRRLNVQKCGSRKELKSEMLSREALFQNHSIMQSQIYMPRENKGKRQGVRPVSALHAAATPSSLPKGSPPKLLRGHFKLSGTKSRRHRLKRGGEGLSPHKSKPETAGVAWSPHRSRQSL